MRSFISESVLGALLVCSVAMSGRAADTGKADAGVSWNVTGELEEACSCHAPCPCWFKAQPSRMTCDGVQIIFINKGLYGKTPLEGLALAQFVQSPEGKSMFESFGNWNFDNVYIDEKATGEQREALKEISRHLFPMAAKERKFQSAPITRKIEGPEHVVTVGNYGFCSGHLIEGGYSGAPKIANAPLADPTHKQYQQGESTKLTYNDAGQGWKYERSNYMYNEFQVDDKEYQKFEAEMARKMAQLNGKSEK